jgi:hypothetical protein
MSASGSNFAYVEEVAVPVAPLAVDAVITAPAPAPATVVQEPAEVSPPLVDPVVVFTSTALLLNRASARNVRTASAFYEILARAYLDMSRGLRQARRYVGPGGVVLPGLDVTEFHTVHLRTMAGRLAYYVSTPGLDIAVLSSSDDDDSSAMSEFSVGAMRASFDSIIESIEDMS